jgi:anaerobic selenocysteine-containing dehydrogenase
MKLSRRDLLRLAAGSAAGLVFTPVPWKILDDSAIWTQNWPGIPEPSAGETTFKTSACTLCGAGCGLRARCVSRIPVRLTGDEAHPLGRGYVCAAGLAAHHLAHHPLRVRGPLKRSTRRGVVESSTVSLDEAIAVVNRKSGPESTVGILDRRPGRSLSALYRRWLGSLQHGVYLTSPPTEHGTLKALQGLIEGHPDLGYDFEHSRMIVSFGTPLFDGWGSPGRMTRLVGTDRAMTPVIVQIEPRYSRTAMLASSWIPIVPGTELILALSLLDVLRQEHLAKREDLENAIKLLSPDGLAANMLAVQQYSPGRASRITGIPGDSIVSLARSMAVNRPAVVLGGGDAGAGPMNKATQKALAALNIAFGSVGTPGGIALKRSDVTAVASSSAAADTCLTDLPDRSLDLLILDASEDGCVIPWPIVERKLRDDQAMVVSFSPFLSGLARHADIIIPSPAPLESLEEIPMPFDASRSGLALSTPLMTPPEGTTDAALVIQQLSLGTGGGFNGPSASGMIRSRMEELFRLRRGTIETPKQVSPLKDLPSVDEVFTLLSAGGVWLDDPVGERVSYIADRSRTVNVFAGGVAASFEEETRSPNEIALLPFGVKALSGTGQVSPILSKVFQESRVRPLEPTALVNPSTCDALGLHAGDAVRITTDRGSAIAALHTDATIIPGAVYVPVGPDPEAINQANPSAVPLLTLCVDPSGTWGTTTATLEKA